MTWPLKRGVLDEAGDVGCAEGSSRYLVIAIVLIGNLHWVAALNVEIVTVILDKQKARRPDDLEDWYRLVCARAVYIIAWRSIPVSH